MEKEHEQKAILFVDIVDSTKFYDSLGDAAAQTLMADAMSMLSDIVMQYSGEVIKTIGDSVMAAFDDADAAAGAAIFMQQIFQTNQISEAVPSGELKITVGLNYGDVVLDQEDVFGNAVIIAARVAAEAKAQQILTTKDTRDLLAEGLIKASRFIVKKELKGLPGEFEIYEILNAEDDANVTTIGTDASVESMSSVSSLVLEYGEKTLEMGKGVSKISIGRSEDNDIIINHGRVSRVHATIELKTGRYVFTDKSANGTFVVQDDEVVHKVHMDHMTLYQSGEIYLGEHGNLETLIKFSHK